MRRFLELKIILHVLGIGHDLGHCRDNANCHFFLSFHSFFFSFISLSPLHSSIGGNLNIVIVFYCRGKHALVLLSLLKGLKKYSPG